MTLKAILHLFDSIGGHFDMDIPIDSNGCRPSMGESIKVSGINYIVRIVSWNYTPDSGEDVVFEVYANIPTGKDL